MAYWGSKVKYTVRPGTPFTIGDGENTFYNAFNIKQSESSYSRNTTSRKYPALSIRLGRQHAFATITTPNALGQRNNEYPHVLDSAVWKRWDGSAWQNVKTGLTSTVGKFLEFNTETDRYTILVTDSDVYSWDGSSASNIMDAPETPYYTVDDYRLYALDGTTLSCSALGTIDDWTTADDADSISLVSAKGEGTAITSYNDVVIAWTEQSMHVLYGNDPYDFYLNDPMNDGCISNKSVIEHRGKLYFLDYNAFKVYTGGRPQEMSQKVKDYIEGINTTYKSLCVSGKQGKYIYLSIPYGSSTTENNITLEYDTELQNWYIHDVGYVDFVTIGEYLYGIDSDGQIWTINSGTDDEGTAISWEHITGVINNGTVSQKKVISDIWAIVDLPSTSTLTISYSTTTDSDDFSTLYTFTGSDTDAQMTRVQIPTTILQNINWYRLKFAGTGPCTIHYLEENYRIKAR
jgi:hypothetical protein